MRSDQIRTPEQALAYVTDCTLATIETMALTKSRSKSEYIRQIGIAQKSLDWMRSMGVDYSWTRMSQVVLFPSVRDWAASFEVKK